MLNVGVLVVPPALGVGDHTYVKSVEVELKVTVSADDKQVSDAVVDVKVNVGMFASAVTDTDCGADIQPLIVLVTTTS